MERVVCYIRVSHQEQKLHGISLDAQRDKLTEYAEKHNLKIVGWYADEGVSGRKLIKHRPELQRMLHDAHDGKFDRILFIKLDRFFRSVAEYHECMKYIDPVLWTATEEKYDLTTANGRAFVNMKLTIAELEADQTGERINLVNDYKVKTGQAMTGAQSQIFGYTVKKVDGIKRVVKDIEVEHIVYEIIEYFLKHQNKRQTLEYIKSKHNVHLTYDMLSNMLINTKLYGHHRGNDHYIDDPYIDKLTFDKIQAAIKRNVKVTKGRNVFLFSGLMVCPSCGRKMTGKYDSGYKVTNRPSGKSYTYWREYWTYRCNKAHKDRRCDYRKIHNEMNIEKCLLADFDKLVNVTIEEASVVDNRANVDDELINKQIKSINSEMTKLKRMYRREDIDAAEYDQEMDILKNDLKVLQDKLTPIQERDLTIYEDLIKSDWKELYNALNKTNKRAFWRKYIKSIEMNKDNTLKSVIFF